MAIPQVISFSRFPRIHQYLPSYTSTWQFKTCSTMTCHAWLGQKLLLGWIELKGIRSNSDQFAECHQVAVLLVASPSALPIVAATSHYCAFTVLSVTWKWLLVMFIIANCCQFSQLTSVNAELQVRTSGQAVHVPLQHIPAHLIEKRVAEFGVHLKQIYNELTLLQTLECFTIRFNLITLFNATNNELL